jgi:hypothetical protein
MECQVERSEHFRYFFTSSVEAPKLQRPPETFVPSTEKTLLLKEQAKNGLCPSSKAILTWVTLRERGGIWWDMEGIIHYGLLERNLTVTVECYCQQLSRLEQTIQQKRPGQRHGVILQHDNARPHTANMTKAAIQELDWDILPHPPYSPALTHRITSYALSPTICAEFPSTTTLSSKIGSTNSSQPNRGISSSVGSKKCPNVGRKS